MTTARIGYGTTLTDKGVAGSGTDAIGEITDLNIGGITLETVDATHMDSADAFREHIAGLLDSGDVTFTLQCLPVNSGSALNWHRIKDNQKARSLVVYEIKLPTNVTATFSAFVTSIGIPIPLDDKITTAVTLKVSGEIVFANA
jgi:hypothetical protein